MSLIQVVDTFIIAWVLILGLIAWFDVKEHPWCLYCGEETEDGTEFCSAECAEGYLDRQEWLDSHASKIS